MTLHFSLSFSKSHVENFVPIVGQGPTFSTSGFITLICNGSAFVIGVIGGNPEVRYGWEAD